MRGWQVKAKLILNVTAVMILLFGIAHTAGYPWIGPVTQIQRDALSNAFRSSVTMMQGFARSYEDTHIGFGFFISLCFAIQAFLVWRATRHLKESPELVRLLSVAFGVQYLVSVLIEAKYLFWGPIIFSLLIAAGFFASALQLRATKRDSLVPE
jgi:hypothetical protein